MGKVILFSLAFFTILVPLAEASEQTECEKALLSMMFDDIYKAVNEHFEYEGVQFTDEKVLDLKVTNGLSFDITIQISTFLGAHNIIGTDTLRFKREVGGIKLVDYRHTLSEYKQEILDWYYKNQLIP